MDVTGILEAIGDPFSYSILFFIYVILAAIILPIPVEVGLFNPLVSPILLVLILALGKGIGAFIVFEIGFKVRKRIKKWSTGTPLTRRIVRYCEQFVRKYGYIGLFIIMSTPLMIDSVSLYLFSFLNPQEGKETALQKSKFVTINIAAGAVRGIVILIVAHYIGIKLV